MRRIDVRYYWKIFWIKDRLYERLIRLWIAGKIAKLAWKISPDLEYEIERAIINKQLV